MSAIHFDSSMDEESRRARLYAGDLFVHKPVPGALALVDFARELIGQAFQGQDPELAQYHHPVEEYAAILAELKPKFIHHPRAKECIQRMLREYGCDPSKTYFDVPRMRSSTSDDYLTAGIAYAFHPHRDTWYSAPMCQLNWWLPIYEVRSDNCMAFHPRYFDTPVKNGSREYNYQEWNRTSRLEAAKHVKADTRKQPRPEEPIELDPQIRLLPPVGGTINFSGAQLHSSVPNDSGRTRFSIDLRTIHFDDVVARQGAVNVDSECTGTPMRDYLRMTDLAHVPEPICLEYERGTPLAAPRPRAVRGTG